MPNGTIWKDIRLPSYLIIKKIEIETDATLLQAAEEAGIITIVSVVEMDFVVNASYR